MKLPLLALAMFLAASPLQGGEAFFAEEFAGGVYAEGQCIMVGGYRPGYEDGAFLHNTSFIGRSENLDDWEITSYGEANGLWGVAYGDSQFVAVGERGLILRSPDGKSWKRESLSGTKPEEWLMDVHYADGHFVAVGTRSVYLSNDGAKWQQVSKEGNFYGVHHANGLWVAVGYGGKISTSEDGKNWKPQKTDGEFMLRSVTYGHGRWIAVGGEGRHGMVTSLDGETWQTISSGSDAQLMDIAFIDGVFLLVGKNRNREQMGTLEYSYDGLNWTTLFDFAPQSLTMICEHKSGWLLAGTGGNIVLSDGTIQRLALSAPWKPKESDRGQTWVKGVTRTLPAPNNSEQPEPVEDPPAEASTTMPHPRIVIKVAKQKVSVTWESNPGIRYRLRRSTNLTDWMLLEDEWIGYGDGNTVAYEEPLLPGNAEVYFRLEVSLTD